MVYYSLSRLFREDGAPETLGAREMEAGPHHGEPVCDQGNQVIGSKAEPKELPSIWTFLAGQDSPHLLHEEETPGTSRDVDEMVEGTDILSNFSETRADEILLAG